MCGIISLKQVLIDLLNVETLENDEQRLDYLRYSESRY